MNKPLVRVDYTDQFKRDFKQLLKKYRQIQKDVQPLIDQLISGETPGDQVPNVGYPVFKVRVGSRDQAKGKQVVSAFCIMSERLSSFYCCVFILKLPALIYLLTSFAKLSKLMSAHRKA